MRADPRPTLLALALALAPSSAATVAAQLGPPPPVAACATAPRSCVEARRSTLKLDLARRRLGWRWMAHNVVSIVQLSNPALGGRGYDFCLYDASQTLVMASGVATGGICNGQACWRARPWGYQYRDGGGGSFGLTNISLKVAAGRRDRLSVVGGGALLPLPAAAPAAPLTVQLVRAEDPTVCWTATLP